MNDWEMVTDVCNKLDVFSLKNFSSFTLLSGLRVFFFNFFRRNGYKNDAHVSIISRNFDF